MSEAQEIAMGQEADPQIIAQFGLYEDSSLQRFINENKLCSVYFAWQESASAFSVSKSDVDKVCKYILNQPEHHRKVTFQEEYETFIKFYQQTLQPFQSSKSAD